ncbi:MAG: outer membrane beta-barrel protein [Bacteroidota bacterium]
MKKPAHWIATVLFPILLLGFNWITAEAQNVQLRGTVIDSSATPLIAATVVLLQPEDSTLLSFAITDQNGDFVLNRTSPGSYYLQITYVGYGNFRQLVEVNEDVAVQQLGPIFLSPKNTLLEEVVVRGAYVPILIKGDTIEYNADAFQTQSNAAVEDLLRKLPGIEVQRDGSIRAQGETVDNVLVDGKEFFGKDTRIATQNLPADIVDKVQVFDKKSEMAEFSGIDDGNEEKTINLSLKEDKKQGYFGMVEGALGSEEASELLEAPLYKGKANINRFSNKAQFSALAMSNNINEAGFSFNDYLNFMGGLSNLMSGSGASLNSSESGIPLALDNNIGITNTTAGGLNFNYDWKEGVDWQSSYFINRIANQTVEAISSQNLGAGENFKRLENNDRRNTNLNHRLNTTLRLKLDSTANLTWVNRLSLNTRDLRASAMAQSMGEEGLLENESVNGNELDGKQYAWSTNLTLRKKFRKPGRILSGNVDWRLGRNEGDILVDNTTTLFENGQVANSEVIFQEQLSDESQNEYRLQLNYTEALGKGVFLGLQASRSNASNDRIRDFYDLDSNNPSARLWNPILSNQYQRDYTYHQLGSTLRYVGKSLKLSAGLDYQRSDLSGDLLSENQIVNQNFDNWLPRLNLTYEFGTSKNIELNYRTRIQAPSLEQLQPLVDNTNPLNLYQGNPNLKAAYIHESNIRFTLFDQFSFTSLFANWNTQYTQNSIINQSTLDAQFRQVISPINTDYDFRTSLYLSYATPLKFIKSKISLDVELLYKRGILFVNQLENNTNRWGNNYTLSLENRKKERIDISAGISLGTSQVSYSEMPDFNQRYFDQTYFLDMTLQLPKKWSIESIVDYTRYSQASFAQQEDLVLWRLKIAKTFLENDRGILSLNLFDLLNQNQGIDRNNSLNFIEERRSNVLGRYVMLSFTYKLSKFGGGEGIQVETSGRR